MLFCKQCGAEVEESFRFCEKCFANLSVPGAVVNNGGLASQAANKAVKSGDFIPDAFIYGYDLSGCRIGNYRLSEKTDTFLGSDYYSAVNIDSGERVIVRYFNIADCAYSDRYKIYSGSQPNELTTLSVRICDEEIKRYKSVCHQSKLLCAELDVSTYISSKGNECHIFIVFSICEPLALKLKKQKMSVRDIVKIALDICEYLTEFERNNVTYNSIYESNIYIDSNGKGILGAEFDRALQYKFIETPMAAGYSMYMPPDHRINESCAVYSLAVMLYKLFNGNRLPYMNFFNKNPDYSDYLNAEQNRNRFFELQMPVNAENMLGNMLAGIIGNANWRDMKVIEVKKTLENALNFLSASELDKTIN